MAKEPWEEDIYDNGEKDLKRTKKSSDVLANRVLTILAVIFFIMVIVIVAGMIYLSVGGGGKTAAKEGFLDTSAPLKLVLRAQQLHLKELLLFKLEKEKQPLLLELEFLLLN